jgi:hypothetical protein
MRQSHLLGLGHHLLSLASEVCLRPPLALPREAIILDAQANVCGPALVRVGAPCDHVPAKFRLPLVLEGAQSLASPSAISIDDSEQEAAPIERGATSSVGSKATMHAMATELLITTIEAAIARGCRHYSESGELLATTLAVLECLQREGFVTVEKPSH